MAAAGDPLWLALALDLEAMALAALAAVVIWTIRQKRRRYREAEGVGGEDPLEEVKVEAEVDLEEDEEEAEESELSSLGTGVSPADFNGSFGSEVADQSRADSEEEEDEWGREDGEEQQLVQAGAEETQLDLRRFEDDIALGHDREVDSDGESVHHLQVPAAVGGIDGSRDEEGKTLLHRAAERGMQNYVHYFVQEGADVETEDSSGRTALQLSVGKLDLETQKELLPPDGRVDKTDNNNCTLLHAAAEGGDAPLSDMLAALGANVDAVDSNGRAPIHLAVQNDSGAPLAVVASLVKNGADVNATDQCGRTALHLAAEKGTADVVEALLQVGAEVNSQDEDGKTPLQFTLDTGNCTPEVALTLVKKGGEELMKKQDNAGRTVLHSAVEKGYVDTVDFLLSNKADPDHRNKDGKTPLFVAVERVFPNKTRMAQCLIPKTRDLGEDIVGRTSAYYAARSELPKLSSVTLNQINEQIDIACELGDLLAFRTLSRWAGYNPQTQEKLDEEVFFRRIFLTAGSSSRPYERFKIATLMLSRQKGLHHRFLDISKVGRHGHTALTLACKNGLDDMAQLLLSTGTQLCCRTQMLSRGTPPPLWQASHGGHSEVLTVLLPFTAGGGTGGGGTPTEKELAVYNAPDGTSPLLVAVLAAANEGSVSFEVIRQLLQLYAPQTVLAAIIKFGSPFQLDKMNNLGIVPQTISSILQALMSENPKQVKRVIESLEESGALGENDIQHLARSQEKHITSLALRKLLNLSDVTLESSLTRMSKEFPRFNSNVEENPVGAVDSDARELSISELKTCMLGEFCPLSRGMPPLVSSDEGGPKSKRISRMNLEMGLCSSDCTQKEECRVIWSMVKALQLMETEIRQDRHLFPLQPVFEIIGSVVEATRLGRANELDVTLSFSSLTGSKSSSLKLARKGDGGGPVATEVTVDERSPLAAFARKAEGRSDHATVQEERLAFDYPRFLHHLLRTIKAGLERAKVSPDWPKNISFQDDWDPSLECCSTFTKSQRTSVYQPAMHCSECHPPVAHTKLGPILIGTVQRGDGTREVLTVDLIPVFPLDSEGLGLLDLFDVVSKTLGATEREEGKEDQERYIEGAMGHFKRVMSVDRVLPESFIRETQKGGGIFEVAFKLLNYGDKTNCIVRPGQQGKYLKEDELLYEKDPGIPKRMSLPKVYTYLKCLKSKLNIGGITSYSVKKVVLTREMRLQLEDSSIDKGNVGEVLYHALAYPDLRKAFGKAIDFETWRERLLAPKSANEEDEDDMIPLLRSRAPFMRSQTVQEAGTKKETDEESAWRLRNKTL